MSTTPRLVMDDGKVIELKGTLTLGRHVSNDVVINDQEASRQHALIQWQDSEEDPENGVYTLVDLDSSNGTKLNGNHVTRPVKLNHGDQIGIGGCLITFKGETLKTAATLYHSTIISNTKTAAWLMVADVIDSSKMSNQSKAEDMPRIIGAWFVQCREHVEKHGGHMDKYLGDGFLCHWNDNPEANEDILNALRVFRDLQTSGDIDFRIALHYGDTVFSGVPTMPGSDLHGPNVNYVFRMEKFAASLKEPMLLSSEAFQRLGISSRSKHQGEIPGYDGMRTFHVPDLGMPET